MKPVPYRDVKRKLEAAGFVQVGQTGSHAKFARTTSEGTLTTTVPKHREVAAGTLRSVLRQARLSQEEFERL
jgi:predicted RNA binding protein YcfA (HicA-like mRNA interferase family)